MPNNFLRFISKATRILLRTHLFGLCFLLSGCGTLFAPRIDDLTFVSASVVNLLDHWEISWNGEKRPSLELLEITFISRSDLLTVARNNEFFLTSTIFFCNDGSEKYAMGLGQISGIHSFGLGSEINDELAKEPFDKDKNKILLQPTKQGMYEYRIYIELVKNARINVVDQSIPAYDLHNPSDNLCAKIHGGNMLGTYFDSNIFTIPKEAVLKGISSSRRIH